MLEGEREARGGEREARGGEREARGGERETRGEAREGDLDTELNRGAVSYTHLTLPTT